MVGDFDLKAVIISKQYLDAFESFLPISEHKFENLAINGCYSQVGSVVVYDII